MNYTIQQYHHETIRTHQEEHLAKIIELFKLFKSLHLIYPVLTVTHQEEQVDANLLEDFGTGTNVPTTR